MPVRGRDGAQALTSRSIDAALGFGYMASLPMENAFNAFKVNRVL